MTKEPKCKACNDTCGECVVTEGDCWSCEDILTTKSNE